MNGQLIGRDHPMLQGSINAYIKTYDMPSDPQFKEFESVLTATSHITGKKINRFNMIHQSPTDLLAKSPRRAARHCR